MSRKGFERTKQGVDKTFACNPKDKKFAAEMSHSYVNAHRNFGDLNKKEFAELHEYIDRMMTEAQ